MYTQIPKAKTNSISAANYQPCISLTSQSVWSKIMSRIIYHLVISDLHNLLIENQHNLRFNWGDYVSIISSIIGMCKNQKLWPKKGLSYSLSDCVTLCTHSFKKFKNIYLKFSQATLLCCRSLVCKIRWHTLPRKKVANSQSQKGYS